MDKIARGLGAERRGKVSSSGATSARCRSWRRSRPASACRPAAAGRRTPPGARAELRRQRLVQKV